jgi:hypothetical protein
MSKVINKAISALTTTPTSAPTPDTSSKPTSAPTTSAKRDRLRKQRIAQLHNNANTNGNSPRIRRRAQLATAAVRAAPPPMSTRARARSSIQSPTRRPGTTPGFAVVVMRQKRHWQGIIRLTCKTTQLENEVCQAMAVMDADTGKLLNYCQLMRSTSTKMHGVFLQQTNLDCLPIEWEDALKIQPTPSNSSTNMKYPKSK